MLISILPMPVSISNTLLTCLHPYHKSVFSPNSPELHLSYSPRKPNRFTFSMQTVLQVLFYPSPLQFVFLFLILANIAFQWLLRQFLKTPTVRFHHSNFTCRLPQHSAIKYAKAWSVASEEGLQLMNTIQGCTKRHSLVDIFFFSKSVTSSCPSTYTCLSQSVSWKALSALGHTSLPAVLQNRKILTWRSQPYFPVLEAKMPN